MWLELINLKHDLTFDDSKILELENVKCSADCTDCNGESGDPGKVALSTSAQSDCYDCDCACPCDL